MGPNAGSVSPFATQQVC